MLGIRLEIDSESVKKAKKEIESGKSKPVSVKEEKVKKSEKIITAEKDKTSKSAGIGGAVGGFIGTLVANLKPIRQLLEVISGFLQIVLSPILYLMRPFLALFLKVGVGLLGLFSPKGMEKTKENLAEGKGIDTSEITSEDIGLTGWVEGIKTKFFDWLTGLFDEWNPMSWADGLLKGFFEVFVTGLGNLFWGFIDLIAGVIDTFIGLFSGDWELMRQGLIKIFTGLGDMFIGIVKIAIGAVGTVLSYIIKLVYDLWEGLKKAFVEIGKIGSWIWDNLTAVLSKSFDVLRGIGDWIWNKITSMFGSKGGGSSKSSSKSNDALITKDGSVHNFNPNDNFIAFQELETLSKLSGSGSSGGNVYITVQGYVGDETELAERVSAALSKTGRGRTGSF